MFWSSIAAHSSISDLLDQSDLTVEQLLDYDNVLQSCREKDRRLIDFLCQDDNVDHLVDLVSIHRTVSDELDVNLYRYPSLACEILTSDIDCLTDAIVQTLPDHSGRPSPNGTVCDEAADQSNMLTDLPSTSLTSTSPSPINAIEVDENGLCASGKDEMNSSSLNVGGGVLEGAYAAVVFGPTDTSRSSSRSTVAERRPRLDRLLASVEAPMNPLSASFISRVLIYLAVQRGSIVVPYMRASPSFLEHILSHFELTAMSDFVVQLAQQDRGLLRIVYEWFIHDRLVPRLIELFDPANSWEVHESVARCLTQLIATLRNHMARCASDSDGASSLMDLGLPINSPYALFLNNDELTHPSATRLLAILESDETINSILDRLTTHGSGCSSLGLNCITVLIWIMDKQKPETGFSMLGGGGPCSEFAQLIGAGSGFLGSVNGSSSVSGFSSVGSENGTNAGNKTELSDKLRLYQTCCALTRACLPRLPRFRSMLDDTHSSGFTKIQNTVGTLDPPFGRLRLSLVQFLALLVALPVEVGLAESLMKENLTKKLMELFEQYPFNTLLHQAVTDFILSLFTRAGVVEAQIDKSTPIDSGNALKSGQHRVGTPPSRTTEKSATNRMFHDKSQHIPMEVDSDDDDDNSEDNDTQDSPKSVSDTGQESNTTSIINTPWDDLFTSVIEDCHFVDWCLRLSPVPSDWSQDEIISPVRFCKSHPKPGYCGHLWNLCNAVEESRNGPRGVFVGKLFNRLPSATLVSWDAFVSNVLTKINEAHVADILSVTTLRQPESFIQLIAQHDLGSLLSQSGRILNISSGTGDAGKLPLLLAPLDFANRSSNLSGKDPYRDDFDLYMDSRLFHGGNDDSNSNGPSSLRRELMADRDDMGSALHPSRVAGLGDFQRVRNASLSSDESDPDDDDSKNSEEEGDDEDEEEDLRSPVVIKQQRSGLTRTTPVIDLSGYAAGAPVKDPFSVTPWDVDADCATTIPCDWAKFEDRPVSPNPTGIEWVNAVPETPDSVNGVLSANVHAPPSPVDQQQLYMAPVKDSVAVDPTNAALSPKSSVLISSTDEAS